MASQHTACLVLLVSGVLGVAAQDMSECFSAGSVAGAVLGTLVVTLALVTLGYALYRMYWRNRRGKHLVLVGDPERAELGDQYAFDNPCFRDGTPIGKGVYEKEPVKSENKSRWSGWSPLGALVGTRNEKRRALDDSFPGEPQVNVVSLRSHDFTGLGFSICGNMRDGIFVKDVLHRGPASESGRITPGDRIDSIRISFRHMVFEDALTILSYASPYEVQLEVENPSPSSRPSTLLRTKRASLEPADRICHPFYRSQSIADLAQIGTASLKRVQDIGGLKSPRRVKSDAWDESRAGEYPTLKLSPVPTKERVNLEKTASPASPTSVAIVKPERTKRPSPKPDSPPSRSSDGDANAKDVKNEAVGKHQKFGVRVLPDPKALVARLKSTSEEVKQRSDSSKKPSSDKLSQSTVHLADNPNIKQSNVTETEHRENEQNSMAEQTKTVPLPSKIVHVGGNASTGLPGGSVDVVDSSKPQGRLVPKTLQYDERGIDVGPAEEEENRRKSASYEPKTKDEDLTKKTNGEGVGVTDSHSNVKLLLTKGLQNLKEKLHHHDRKKTSTTPEPQLDVEVNPNPSPSKKKPGKEKLRKSSSSDSDGTPEKTEVKMRISAPSKMLNIEDKDKEHKKDLKSDGERHPNEGQIPTDMPEEVRRAAVAARSNRKSCSNLMPDTNMVSLDQEKQEVANDVQVYEQLDTQTSSVSPPDASTIKQRVHQQDSWSEDSSGDANDADSVDRAPRRSNKRKAPLPPPEDGDDIKSVPKTGSLELNGIKDYLHQDKQNDSNKKQEHTSPVAMNNNEIQVIGGHSSSGSSNTFTEMARQQNNPPVHNEITNIIVGSNSSPEPNSLKVQTKGMENISIDVVPPSIKKPETNSESDSDHDHQDLDSSPHRNKKGGTTIELNSSHITIHHSPSSDTVTLELEGDSTRKAASLGDLSRFDSDQPMSVLERAVSLDLADSGTPHSCKKRKAPLPPPGGEDYLNTMQDNEDETLYRKEPRLDNALDTFQRRRLKKSSDWGTMEDAVQQASPPTSRKSLNSVSDTDAVFGDEDTSQVIQLGKNDSKTNSEKLEFTEMNSAQEEAPKHYVAQDSITITNIPKASARTLDSKGQPHLFSNSKNDAGDHIHVQVMSSHIKTNGQDRKADTEVIIDNGLESHGPQRTILRITPEPISNMDQVSSSRVTFAPTPTTSGPSSLSTDEIARSLTPDEDNEIAGSRLMTIIQGYKDEADSMITNLGTSFDSTPVLSQSTEHHTIVSSTPLPNREHHTQYMGNIQSPQVTSTEGGVQNIQVVSSSTHTSSPPDLKNISRINRNLLVTPGFDSTLSSKSDDSFNDTDASVLVTSGTDQYVTAGSVVDSTTYISNSDDEDSTLGQDLPPELPTSPVPVMASSYTPSSSMTYITEIQVSTITPTKIPAPRSVTQNGSHEMGAPGRKRDSSISSDSIGSGGEDKDVETKTSLQMKEESTIPQHNNVTVTSIRNAAIGNIDKSKIPTRIGTDGILTTFQSSPNVGVFERSQIPMRTGTEGVMTTFHSSTSNLKNTDSSQIPIRVGSEGVLTTFKSNVSVGSGERSQIPTRISTTNMHDGSSIVNNGPSNGEKKNKPVRPPVPPRKSDTAVSSVVTVELPSPIRSMDNIQNKLVNSSNPYGVYDSNSNTPNSGGNKKFISFSSLTPRSVSGDNSGRNSSFEQWVFLEGDHAHTSNGNTNNVEDNPHSTVVTLPLAGAGRPPSVTHILLDAKQSSGSRSGPQ